MPHWTAVVTCLVMATYLVTVVFVSRGRRRFGVAPPTTIGHPDFERVFRTQMNTLEWMPIILPSLWLAGATVSDLGAAVLGLIWIAGRVLYMRGYAAEARQRTPGFIIQALAATLLLVVALIGTVVAALHA